MNANHYVASMAAVVAAFLGGAWLWQPTPAPRQHGLFMYDPVRVGHRQDAWTETGRRVTLETLASQPRLFKVDNFLTHDECDALLASVDGKVMRSQTLGDEGVIRVSDQAWIQHARANESGHVLSRRAAAVARLPPSVVHGSEDFQAARYGPGGHYYLHLDSGRNYGVARFLTLLVYLTDVEEGGETAFPLADDFDIEFPEGDPEEFQEWPDPDTHASMPTGWLEGDPEAPNGEPWDLSRPANCRRRVAVAPKKGSAVLWYNHLPNTNPDPAKWKEVGGLDVHSLHGACDLVKGEKWVANVWINPPNWYERAAKKRPRKRLLELQRKY